MTPSEKIRHKALEMGFDAVGIARCRPLTSQRETFDRWLERGYDGSLDYLRRTVDKRFDPALLFEGARSVVVCAASYKRPPCEGPVASRIASYARSRDYHLTIKEKLFELLKALEELMPGSRGRVFTDTAPLSEKSWAVEAGLGWIGRHSLLVHPRLGSFLLLGEIVTTAELEPDAPFEGEGCGPCRACMEACPAGAILPDRKIDAGRCISRRTVEKAEGDEGDLHGWLFGCDACQLACPRNRRATETAHPLFAPIAELEASDAAEWTAMTQERFDQLYGETPLNRCGLARIQARIRKLFP